MTLTHLWHFLSCYGYHLFKGFKLEPLWAAESLQLVNQFKGLRMLEPPWAAESLQLANSERSR